MNAAVMAGGHHHADGLLVVHLGAIGAGIEPALLRIAGDGVGAGADIAAAVLLVPFRRRELGDVDLIAHHDILEHRPVLDDDVGHDALLLQIGLAVGVAELPFAEVIGKAERHVAARAGEHVEQQAKALRAARDVLEHHARAVLGPQHRLGGEPDVLLAVRALDRAHLAQTLGHRQPFAQIVVGDIAGEVSLIDHVRHQPFFVNSKRAAAHDRALCRLRRGEKGGH
jgi:hypothetical protein